MGVWARRPARSSEQAQRGSELFFFNARCATCQRGSTFQTDAFIVLAVGWNAETQSFADEGQALATGDARDLGAFKTPGLRDVSRARTLHA